VVLTGARQVGKTTLTRRLYGGDLRYVNLDSPGERARLAALPAEGWARAMGPAVLDEIQKAPELLDKLKWAYDERQLDFSVLLGSSRILLLEQVRETLAGRVFLHELWPMTIAELAAAYGGSLPERPWIAAIVAEPGRLAEIAADGRSGLVGPEAGAAQAAAEHLLRFGGLPTLLEYADDERFAWLESYQATYLERDLADLAQLRDLDAFAHCHRLAAHRVGALLSYSELARDAGLPVTTVRRYLRYLELSYQTTPLPAWASNPSVRLVKAPKLLWFDLGVQRSLSGQLEGLTGEQYESTLAGQILVTLKTLGVRHEASHFRTGAGLEVDLVLENQHGLLAFEFKNRAQVTGRDARPIESARRHLGASYRGGLIVYRGVAIQKVSETVWAVPDWWLVGRG
jgi:uncharacterized protein